MSDDKRQLRKDGYRIAHDLIRQDNIEQAAEVLADYQERFGQSADPFLKRGLALLFALDLMRDCRRHQVCRVSHIINEHLLCESSSYQQAIRRHELTMYLRHANMAGASICMKHLVEDDYRH